MIAPGAEVEAETEKELEAETKSNIMEIENTIEIEKEDIEMMLMA